MREFVSLTVFSPARAEAFSKIISRTVFWLDEESHLSWGARPRKGGCPFLLIAGAGGSSYYGEPLALPSTILAVSKKNLNASESPLNCATWTKCLPSGTLFLKPEDMQRTRT